LNLLNWNCFVGVCDVASDRLELYVNGVSADIKSGISTSASQSTIAVGGHGANYLLSNGYFAHAAWWNRVLSQPEITYLYNAAGV